MAISVVEAGRKGGLKVLGKRGRAFYSEIGRKGQQAMRQKYPYMASEWGRLGGRPRKMNLSEMGQEDKLGKEDKRTRLFTAAYPAPPVE